MDAVTWSQEHETGIAAIDAQHQRLYSMIADFQDAMKERRSKEKIGEVLDFLCEYVGEHFQDEERLMEAHKFPGYLQHKHVHEALARKVQKLVAGYKRGDTTLTAETSLLLLEWIQEHIEQHDMEYVPFFKGKGIVDEDSS